MSGLGDLVLTCTGDLSRNRHVGIELGRGRSLDEILAGMRMVAEGVRTTARGARPRRATRHRAADRAQMAAVLEGRRSPAKRSKTLMLRPQRAEADRVMDCMGFFDRIKQSLTRTKQQFVERFDEVVKRADAPEQRTRPVDVETIEALEEALISADVGVAATEQIVEAVKRASDARRIAARSREGGDPRDPRRAAERTGAERPAAARHA